MTNSTKSVRDIMIDVFEFPHMPYWFTLRQLSGILKKSLNGGKCLRPVAALIFDEKYNILGHVDHRAILAGIGSAAMPSGAAEGALSEISESASAALAALSEQQVSSLLIPVSIFADPDDSLDRAAEFMLRNSMQILPVLENQKKLVGIVRDTEVFEHLSTRFFRA